MNLLFRSFPQRVLELELEQSRMAASSTLSGRQWGQQQQLSAQEGAFSLSSIKAAIEAAVKEACACPDEEKKKKIRQLQLRWHPDKVCTGW